ncbi:MAG: Trm112 family protein [Candidatus Wallbacteria bacterium]|nr:Trm112 family protein [Candidatus Wallbacteria bacterium]
MLKKELLEILACPICKKDVEYLPDKEQLLCHNCRKKYPVRNGIPVMLPEEAESY